MILAAILAWGLASQVMILTECWQENPFARVPIVDGAVYWRWAEGIGAGRLVGGMPFMSAPLYPYLLGLLRAAGGGLLAVYVVQAGLHLVTAGLIAYGTARRFAAPAGLVAAGLFVLLTEPAFFAGRVLNCTLQLFLVAALWIGLLRVQQRPSARRWALVGALTGLNCLANPPMLLAVPLLALWAAWLGRWRRPALGGAAILAGTAAAAISPAAIHNYWASGEFIPISAQAGLTFAQGNLAGAEGAYTRIPGISADRAQQNRDAMLLYRQATGESGGWNAVNRFFFRQGLDAWRSDPGQALHLFLKKLYRFATNRNVDEFYSPGLEVRYGFADWLRTAPLAVPWLILPGLVTLVALLRAPCRYMPEIVLFGLPLLVVLIFFFTPRYRLPAAPLLAAMSAWALWQAMHWRRNRTWAIATAGAVVLAGALTSANRACDYDTLAPSAHFFDTLGSTLGQVGRTDEAAVYLHKAIELEPGFVGAHMTLGTLLYTCGDPDGALREFREAVRLDPTSARGHAQVANVLWSRGDVMGTIAELRSANELAPADAKIAYDLARMLAATPHLPPVDRAKALELARALTSDPRLRTPATLDLLAIALAANGQFREAVDASNEGISLAERRGDFAAAHGLRARRDLFRDGRRYFEPSGAARP